MADYGTAVGPDRAQNRHGIAFVGGRAHFAANDSCPQNRVILEASGIPRLLETGRTKPIAVRRVCWRRQTAGRPVLAYLAAYELGLRKTERSAGLTPAPQLQACANLPALLWQCSLSRKYALCASGRRLLPPRLRRERLCLRRFWRPRCRRQRRRGSRFWPRCRRRRRGCGLL